MKRTAMTTEKKVQVQNWKVGDSVVANETDFSITEGKVYQILKRGRFYDCFIILDDEGVEEEYSQEYFDLLEE